MAKLEIIEGYSLSGRNGSCKGELRLVAKLIYIPTFLLANIL